LGAAHRVNVVERLLHYDVLDGARTALDLEAGRRTPRTVRSLRRLVVELAAALAAAQGQPAINESHIGGVHEDGNRGPLGGDVRESLDQIGRVAEVERPRGAAGCGSTGRRGLCKQATISAPDATTFASVDAFAPRRTPIAVPPTAVSPPCRAGWRQRSRGDARSWARAAKQHIEACVAK